MRFLATFQCLAAAALSGLLLLAGCASDQAMPKTASSADPLASQARRMRSGEADRDGSGLSSQSRDVEKDLGLR
jgi:outer membrane murein-binding lipoprotein Lpp